MRLCLVLAGLILSVGSASLPAQRVWVVAPNLDPGVDFTDIQPAVDAASDFDTVLVHVGSYGGFTIDGKGLFVHADIGGAFANPPVRIAHTTPTQLVVLRGFSTVALSVDACLGPVLVENCGVSSALGKSPAVEITGSQRATFSRCNISGSQSAGIPLLLPAGDGLYATSSHIALESTVVTGGFGSPFMSGGIGGVLTGSVVSASDSMIFGGGGFPPVSGLCPSNGGTALVMDATSSVFAFGTTVDGGTVYASPSPCPPAIKGAKVAGTGTLTELTGTAGRISEVSPARAGQLVHVNVTAPAGTNAFVLASPLHNPVFVRGCVGTLDSDLSLSLTLPLGLVPASGTITLPLTVPKPLGLSSANLYMQVVTTRPGQCILGNTTAFLLLDNIF